MTNLEKYHQAFVNGLEIAEDMVNSELTYQGIDNWDSVGHMNLIAEIEDAFDIVFETDDIIDFNSYEKGKELLKKYDVEI